MVVSGERSYIYAKICGIIGKSFVGKRISNLINVNRLADLDRLVFPDSSHELPEKELLTDIENRITKRAVEEIVSIIDCFKDPPKLLVLLLRSYEYTDLKGALGALANGEPKPPAFTDIGRFAVVKFGAYPDLKAMLKGTDLSFLLDEDLSEIVPLQTKLDQHYYNVLLDALSRIPRSDRIGIEKIIEEEMILRNICWGLRLRTYYGMNIEKIQEMFISIGKKNVFTKDAVSSLNFALDIEADWEHWKWAEFVNREKTGNFWKIDPRYFQNKASQYLYKCTYHALRLHPFTLETAFCFIRLKQTEEDLLTSIAEGFNFGVTSRESLTLLGALQ